MEGARVLVVSGDPDLQREVRERLEHGGHSVDVCAAASTAEGRLAKWPPAVVLVDLGLPELDAVHFVVRLARGSPSLAVIALARRGVDERVVAALRAGARGCLYVDDLADRLLAAVTEARGGRSPVSRGMADLLVEAVRRTKPASSQGRLAVRPLSEHECRVLAQLARGFTYEDVARSLGVSINTVRTQVRAIYDKLDVSSRTEAALLGMRLGLVKLVPIALKMPTADACDAHPRVSCTAESNEPVTGGGSGATAYDVLWNDGQLFVRSERAGTLRDRVYTVTCTSKDASGNATTATTQVTVPHSQ